MKNLACREPSLKQSDEVTLQCLVELQEAGIDQIISPTTPVDEVPSRVSGKLGPFKFERAWRYWVCSGPMPLQLATQIHFATLTSGVIAGKVIRAAGHGNCLSPEEVVEYFAKDGRKYLQDTPEQRKSFEQFKHIIERTGKMKDRFVWATQPAEEAARGGFSIVRLYHVDTQDGLNFLAEKIKMWDVIHVSWPVVQLT